MLTVLKIKFLQISTYYSVPELKDLGNKCGCTGKGPKDTRQN